MPLIEDMPKKYFCQFIAEMVDSLNHYADLIQKFEPDRKEDIAILRKAANLIPETRDDFFYLNFEKDEDNDVKNETNSILEKKSEPEIGGSAVIKKHIKDGNLYLPKQKYPSFVTYISQK